MLVTPQHVATYSICIGQVYDTFSSDLRGVSEESFTSTENGTSLSAHGAQVAPSGRPLGGANL
jgi:hypothetical protein